MSQFTQIKKYKTYEKITKFIGEYKQIILCEIKDLPADMVHKIRKQLRDINSEVVCGKAVRKLNIKKNPFKFYSPLIKIKLTPLNLPLADTFSAF